MKTADPRDILEGYIPGDIRIRPVLIPMSPAQKTKNNRNTVFTRVMSPHFSEKVGANQGGGGEGSLHGRKEVKRVITAKISHEGNQKLAVEPLLAFKSVQHYGASIRELRSPQRKAVLVLAHEMCDILFASGVRFHPPLGCGVCPARSSTCDATVQMACVQANAHGLTLKVSSSRLLPMLQHMLNQL